VLAESQRTHQIICCYHSNVGLSIRYVNQATTVVVKRSYGMEYLSCLTAKTEEKADGSWILVWIVPYGQCNSHFKSNAHSLFLIDYDQNTPLPIEAEDFNKGVNITNLSLSDMQWMARCTANHQQNWEFEQGPHRRIWKNLNCIIDENRPSRPCLRNVA
jgi:hypothetical protein